MDADKEILGVVHGAGRDSEGDHGDAESVDVGMQDLHS
jgi:hypothetical protein